MKSKRIWEMVKECAQELTREGIVPFTRPNIIDRIQIIRPDSKPDAINPIIQGLTDNLKGGVPSAGGVKVLHSVGRGQFELIKNDSLTESAVASNITAGDCNETRAHKQVNRASRSSSSGERKMVQDATKYSRDKDLQERLNSHLAEIFGLPEADYYSKINTDGLLRLKSAISDIHNILTLRLTMGFVEWIKNIMRYDAAAVEQIRRVALITKPNANGYDVSWSGEKPFAAEVKCNIPNGADSTYKANQKNGIIKDIDSLLKGKSKARPLEPTALKFMVFLDMPAIRAANDRLIQSSGRVSKAFCLLPDGVLPDDPRRVYGVYIPL